MTIEEAIERLNDRYMVVSMCVNSEEARAENEALDMAIAALRAQSTNDGQTKSDGWISVEDRLPRDGERVLVYRDNMDELSISVVYGWTVLNKAHERGITHWMPLPEPLKSEGGDEP